MRRLKGRRPSAPLVISILALFVALGGSAFAASQIRTDDIKNRAVAKPKLAKNAVAGNKIKNKTINGKKIKAGAVTGAKIGDGVVGDGNLDSATKTRWAVVTAGGDLRRSRGVSATTAADSTGNYNVTVDRDITACSWVATIGSGNTEAASNGIIRTRLETDTTNTVRVHTADTSGGAALRAFHLIVHC